MMSASWILRRISDSRVICETFDVRKVAALNTARYEAVPILDYLRELNTAIKMRAILASLQVAIETTPDAILRDAWLSTEHGTALYYLGLSELTYERSYDAGALLSEHAAMRDAGGCTLADMAWIDARRGK